MWHKQASLGLAAGLVLLTGCGMYQGADRETSAVRPAGQQPAGGYLSRMLPGNVPPGAKDELFAAEAAHGSASEMEASRIALDRAKHQQVKDYARMLLDDHRKASQQLIDLAQRKGFALAGVPSAGVEQKTREMQRSKADSFDADYLNQMMGDHIRTLNMFRDVANSSPDPDVRAWASSQISTARRPSGSGLRRGGAAAAPPREGRTA